MRSRLRFIPLALIAVLTATAAYAEPLGRYWTLTPFGGFTIFDGDLKYPQNFPLKDNVYFGGRVGWQAKKWMGFEVAGGFTPTEEDVISGATKVDWAHLSGDLMFTPWSSRYGGPFILAGAGMGQLKPTSGSDKTNQGSADYGLGLNFWLTDGLGLRFEARQLLWVPKESGDEKFTTTVIGGGLTFALGATPRDTDGDGVPDKKDTCPDTPKGARVDATGCPHDSDGDGVLDGLDNCPQTPKGATVNQYGCPSDLDGDGVFDGIDQSPNTPKGVLVDAHGFPMDADSDGVFDGIDKCANTPIGAKVDSIGCPKDSDGDGVFDGLDKCPETPEGAKVDITGCPVEVIERETEMLDTGMIRLQDVDFAAGKSDVPPEAYATLDIVGQLLTKWPDLKIEVGGHTDSQGSAAKNQKLSEARAQSVLDYLDKKFPTLKTDQFTVKGYGLTKPIAPNTNELGRSKNRRVEFVVLNKDALKKETERRRLLQKNEGAPAQPDKK